MNKIKEKYGTFECLELKKKGVSCNEIIEYAYNMLKEYSRMKFIESKYKEEF